MTLLLFLRRVNFLLQVSKFLEERKQSTIEVADLVAKCFTSLGDTNNNNLSDITEIYDELRFAQRHQWVEFERVYTNSKAFLRKHNRTPTFSDLFIEADLLTNLYAENDYDIIIEGYLADLAEDVLHHLFTSRNRHQVSLFLVIIEHGRQRELYGLDNG